MIKYYGCFQDIIYIKTRYISKMAEFYGYFSLGIDGNLFERRSLPKKL